MLGYELLLAPLALHLRAQLRPASGDDTGMVDLYTFYSGAWLAFQIFTELWPILSGRKLANRSNPL
jgi:hypothetical protein